MSRSSIRGIFLIAPVLLFSITVLAVLPSDVYAQEATVSSIGLEETVILELTNDADAEISVLRIWLYEGFNFESFKTESGWTAQKNSAGVVIFTSPEPIKTGESVKFGVKTSMPVEYINWKALDGEENVIGLARTIISHIPPQLIPPPPIINGNGTGPPPEKIKLSINDQSTFRIIPEKPSIGSLIRVVGENFGASYGFDFYVDDNKVGAFNTDQDGNFITTVRIPEDQEADRTDFIVRDKDGAEKKVSMRIEAVVDRIVVEQNVPLTVNGIQEVIRRGESLIIFGTGVPNGAITATITTNQGEVINTRTAEIDAKGSWELDEPIIVPLESQLGKYSATITDGRESKTVSWTIESDKKIVILPTTFRYSHGEAMKFNGTAIPNTPIELILEDPRGNEIASRIIHTNNVGTVEFSFTSEQNTLEGTYTLIASQGKYKEFIYVGLEELPAPPIRFEFDKLNYKSGEIATITLSGEESEIIDLIIVDSSDQAKGDIISITLQPDGRGVHTIKLSDYSPGIYTAVVSKGSTQSAETFTVGLKLTPGDIEIRTTKLDYHRGDSILILGEVKGSNSLLKINMINPDGEIVKTRTTFADKNGKITEDSFRIPLDAQKGEWTINAQGASSFDNVKIDVLEDATEGMIVEIRESTLPASHGKSVNIHIFGARQNVEMTILSIDGQEVAKLKGTSTRDGEINQPWPIPKEIVPGEYIIRVTDGIDSAETTFIIP